MVQYLQNKVIMKWTTCFIRFTSSIPLKYMAQPQLHLLWLTVKKTDVKPRISNCDPQNLQYKVQPEFLPSHWRIFKTSLYYKKCLMLENWR